MATVYSGEVAVGTYNRIRIQCDYSGTSANLTVQFRRTSSRYDRWSDSNATLTFNGQSKGAAYSYSGTVGTSWVNLVTVTGYTISASGGTYSWQFNNPTGGVLGCSGDIVIPSQGNPPSGGYIDELRAEYNLTNRLIEFYSSNAGVSSSTALTSLKFLILKVPYTTSGLPRQEIAFTNNSSVTLNKNNSTALSGGVTILGNDLYYAGIYAANSIGDYRYNGPSVVSPCEPATFSFEPININSIAVSYATVADGGYYSKTLEYSLDGESWNTGATVSSGAASSGTFNISSLDPYKEYTIRFRVTTPAGFTDGESISFTLLKPKFYGPVNSLTEKTNKLYGSLNNQSKTIVKFYASENGRAKLIYKEK